MISCSCYYRFVIHKCWSTRANTVKPRIMRKPIRVWPLSLLQDW